VAEAPVRHVTTHIKTLLTEALAVSGMNLGGDEIEDVVNVVVDRLAREDISEYLTTRVRDALMEADTAWNLRDDLVRYPWGPEVASRIAAGAILGEILRARAVDPMTGGEESSDDLDAMRARLSGISYRDWKFTLEVDPPLPSKVKVWASFEDMHHPGTPFRVSRSSPVWFGDVEGAAFDAVMRVEEHEAMERFAAGGVRILDPHAPAKRSIAPYQYISGDAPPPVKQFLFDPRKEAEEAALAEPLEDDFV
jgi:hypothetical protein